MKDLQELYKENPSDAIKADISNCLKKIIEQRQKSVEKPETKVDSKSAENKVQEVKVQEGVAKQIKIEEGSSDSDDAEIIASKKPKSKVIDEQTLQAAKQKASAVEIATAM